MTPRIFNINEAQYRKLFLNEKLHYDYSALSPLLRSIRGKLCQKINEKIKLMQNNNVEKYKFNTTIRPDVNKYCDNIIFSITIQKIEGNIQNVVAQYVNDKGELDTFTKKLIEPQIKVFININTEYEYNKLYLLSHLSHELTHLIDDYEELQRGNPSLSYNTMTGTIETLRNLTGENIIIQTLFNIVYTGYKFEEKAFIIQSYHEFEKVGCTPLNYKAKYKETLPYQNYMRMFDKTVKTLQTVSNEELEDTNYLFNTVYKDKNIPKLPINNFNPNAYRQKLIGLAEKIKHDFLKKYGGVLTAYLDDYKRVNNII